MDLTQATSLATTLMQFHGAGHYAFGFDNARTRAGLCNYRLQRITLSKHFVMLNPEDEVAACILHEIGHVLAGPHAGHGPSWARAVRSIGGNPQRLHKADMPDDAPYYAICKDCGFRHQMRRLTAAARRGKWCKCNYQGFKPENKLVWLDSKTGAVVA